MNNLFAGTASDFTEKHGTIYTDGGSRGNPGPAGAGCVLYIDGVEVATARVWCGIQTNNFAEYTSLIRGMQLAQEHGVTHLYVRMDSKLVIEQMAGRWKVKNANIRPLWERACSEREKLIQVKFEHVRREKNTRADQLANEAMDRGH